MSVDRGSVLVTGAAGFIGSHVAEALVHRGTRVVGLDNFDSFYSAELKRRAVREVADAARLKNASFTMIEADIRDAAAMREAMSAYDVRSVIHLAARAGVRPSIEQPALYASVNVEGTACLLEAAREAKCTRFVCASSSSVYGNNPKVPFAEHDAVDRPISPYAATKVACELMGHTFHHVHGMPVAILRFFTAFGPRQRPDLAIARFLSMVSRGDPLPLYGDGTSSRDYTYVDDIVEGVLSAHDRIEAHGYRVWNLGGSNLVTLNEVVATVERVVGKEAKIERFPMQPGDVERTFADLTRSRDELGYAPKTTFEDGVRAQWEWWLRMNG